MQPALNDHPDHGTGGATALQTENTSGAMTITGKTIVFIAVLFAVIASPVHSIEIFGIKLFEREEPDVIDLIDPLDYGVELTVLPAERKVERAIRRASALIRGAGRPALGRSGLIATAKNDYGEILKALYKTGHYGGEVSIMIEGHEAATIPLNVQLPELVRVTIRVSSGPVYFFDQTDVANASPDLQPGEIGFEHGAPAYSDSVGEVAVAAVDGWRTLGYARADVKKLDVVADHDSKTVDVAIDIDPGPLAKYGETRITGARAVDEEFLRYMTATPPGKRFDGQEISDARRRLLKLGAFRSVTVDEAEDIAPDGTLDIEVTVEERKPRRLGAGVTVSTLDGLGVEGFWLHRNILGRAERLRFDASVSRIGRSADPGDYNWEVGINFLKPGTLTPDTDFSLSVTADRELTKSFDARTLEVATGYSTVFDDQLTGDIQAILQRSFTRDDLGERDFITIGAKGSLTFDSRDDALDPKTGYYAALTAFPFHELEFGNSGFRATAEARAYRVLDAADQYVLAGRVKFGSLMGIAADVAPNSALFFSGGGGSVRGYAYQSNGVFTGGDVVGGKSLIEASAELRAGLTDRWGLVGFVDVGIVGPDATPDFGADLKSSAGLGVRYNTGLGPIRVDVARGLDRRGSDPNLGVYIGLGQSF